VDRARADRSRRRGRDDCALSYLPLSHIAEQMSTIHVPATSGATVYFAESIDKVPDNLKEVQPTVVFGVPRIWEKFHAGVTAKLAAATGAKAKLVRGPGRLSSRHRRCATAARSPVAPGACSTPGRSAGAVEAQAGAGPGPGPAVRHRRRAAGQGRHRVLRVARHLPLYEIYGQSEDCGPTSFNLPGATKFGTVGKPLPGVEVKLADDGEILVRGPNVFLGYFKEPEATARGARRRVAALGRPRAFDADGFLSITGRKKEILITAGGKNIAPKNIEAALKESPLVAEAVVIGDRRKFLSALITVDDAAVAALGDAPTAPATAGPSCAPRSSAARRGQRASWPASSRSRSSRSSSGRSRSRPAS
jgi:long-chain acyl-CoA synthetase